MVLDDEMLQTKHYFQSLQIPLCDFWLESCINWFREQNLTYTEEQLRSEVYKQWLFLDFRDIETPSLPPNIKQWKNNLLQGNFCLQMLCVADISKPKYYQLQKIRNTTAMALEEDSSDTKRMLQITLTDSVNEINALEYTPIPALKVSLIPGTKIRVIGPVMVRRGKLMLEERNVKVLGGEVEEIAVTNAAENVLARFLNLPMNPNPNCNFADNFDLEAIKNVADSVKTAQNNLKVGLAMDQLTEEEELQMAEQIDFLIENENRANTSNPDANTKPADVDIFEDFDFVDTVLDEIDNELASEVHSKKQESSDHRNLLQPDITKIKKILSMDHKTERTFKIKAEFKTVTEKLTINDNKWVLKMLIGDDTAEIEVTVHDEIIWSLIGYSAVEATSLKKNERYKILRAIENFKNKLTVLNCEMKVVVKSNGGVILISIEV